MAKTQQETFALVGADTLMGRELRDVLATGPSANLKLLAEEEGDAGKLTSVGSEAALFGQFDEHSLDGVQALFLAGSADSTRRALGLKTEAALIDLTHAAEEAPQARVRAPMVEPAGYSTPPGTVYVIAHPAAIALALVLGKLQRAFTVARSLAHIFEPASERGMKGVEELQQQTVSLLSFKGMPKAVFDSQLAFNMLARYGEEASLALESVELRVERHLASLLALESHAPMPSLRLIQAPVFHGHSLSLWIEFERNPDVEAIEQALISASIDLRGAGLEPPTNVGIAGQNGVAVGAISLDRNHPRACWMWIVVDNLRLMAENAVLAARS